MKLTLDSNKYSGCFLGLVIGDAFGAGFEGAPLERLLWKVLGKTKDGRIRYTDDTQMSIDLANSFLQNDSINQDHLAEMFAKGYRWSRGYGPGTARLLKKIRNGADWRAVNRIKFKAGSWGNGAAMRAPVLAMCIPEDVEQLSINIVKCSEITHGHPLAIEGAKLISLTTHAALHDWSTEAILKALPTWCCSDEFQKRIAFCVESIRSQDTIQLQVLRRELGNGIAASQSCVTAVYFALAYRRQSHDTMFTQIFRLGGDTDTIGAMSGAIWGAFNGYSSLDKEKLQQIENSGEIMELSRELHRRYCNVG